MKKLRSRLHWFLVLACCLVLGAGCSKSAKAKRLLASADRDFQSLQYDSAEIKYRGVLRLSFMNPVAIRQLGFLYYNEGRSAEAGFFLNKALGQDPNNLEVQVRMAQTFATVGNVKGASDLISKVLPIAPTNEDALLLLVDLAHSPADLESARHEIENLPVEGAAAAAHDAALAWIYLRENKTNEAEPKIQEALKLNPKLVSAYLAMAALDTDRKATNAASDALKTAADLSPIRSTTRIKYADFLFQSGSTNEAKNILQDTTRQAPDYIPAWINLMHLFFAERNYDQCADVVAKVLARDPNNYDGLMQSGNLSLAKRDAAAAVKTLKRLDSLHNKVPIVKYRLAVAYLMNGNTSEAIATLTEASKINASYPPTALLLAELDLRTGNSSAAINLLVPLVKKSPEEARAHILLATAYLARRQPADALAVYREMEKVFPKNPEVQRLIGSVYEQEGDVAAARDAFEKSLALSPDYLPALDMITDLDFADKRYTNAENRIAATISRNPKEAEPWLLQGRLFWAIGQTNQAESSMSKAIELSPELTSAYLTLAQLYVAENQVPQAMARLTSLLAKTNDVTALLERGELHQQAEQFDDARDDYEKLLTYQPRFVPALNNLAYLYSERYGNLEKAAEMANRAREIRPNDPFVADTYGWVLYLQGQYQRALPLLQESVEKQPNTPEVQMHLGMDYYMMDEEDLARLNLRQATSSSTDFAGKDDARKCLELLSIDPATATPEQIEVLQKRERDNPRDPLPLNRLAAIDELRGQTDKAAATYEKLISQDSQNWKAMIKLARLYSGPLHDSRKALDLAKSAHQIAPNDPRAAATLGELVYASGDYPWALNLLEEAAPQLPNQPSIQYSLALAYYAVGRLHDADAAMEEAVKAGASFPNLEQAKQFQAFRAAANDPSQSTISNAQIQSVLEKDPHYLPALMLSALLAERQEDYKKAGQAYDQILAEYPNFAPAMRQLALIYTWHSGDETKAYELGQKARLVLPDDLELARALGVLAYRRAEYQRSAQLLSESARKYDKDAELLYYLGMDYYQLKQRSQSKKALERALALNVRSPLADEAKRVLGELK